MSRFGTASLEHLRAVHPSLALLFQEVVQHWDCAITDGVRSIEEQRKNVARGVSQTMDSKHLPRNDQGELDPKGVAWAVDAVPYPVDWKAIQRGLDGLKRADPGMQVAEFYGFIGFVQGFAAARGIDLRVGADWDGDREFSEHQFVDLPHFELRSPKQ